MGVNLGVGIGVSAGAGSGASAGSNVGPGLGLGEGSANGEGDRAGAVVTAGAPLLPDGASRWAQPPSSETPTNMANRQPRRIRIYRIIAAAAVVAVDGV